MDIKKLNESLRDLLNEANEYKWRLGKISEIGAYENYPCLLYGDDKYGMLIAFNFGKQDKQFYTDWETGDKYVFSTMYDGYSDGFSDETVEEALKSLNNDKNVKKYFSKGVPMPPIDILERAIKDYNRND